MKVTRMTARPTVQYRIRTDPAPRAPARPRGLSISVLRLVCVYRNAGRTNPSCHILDPRANRPRPPYTIFYSCIYPATHYLTHDDHHIEAPSLRGQVRTAIVIEMSGVGVTLHRKPSADTCNRRLQPYGE